VDARWHHSGGAHHAWTYPKPTLSTTDMPTPTKQLNNCMKCTQCRLHASGTTDSHISERSKSMLRCMPALSSKAMSCNQQTDRRETISALDRFVYKPCPACPQQAAKCCRGNTCHASAMNKRLSWSCMRWRNLARHYATPSLLCSIVRSTIPWMCSRLHTSTILMTVLL
jgi:hypothetical protein